jgi:ketosteroid isomerase-like protein
MKTPALRAIALLVALPLAACVTVPAVGDEASLRAVDERQRILVAARDADGMAALADPDLRINAPTNTIIPGAQLVAMMRSGAVAAEAFERMPESVVRSGDIGIVMGRERLTATPDSASGQMFGARQLERRYTNVYRWRDGRWRFLARHANVIPPAAD